MRLCQQRHYNYHVPASMIMPFSAYPEVLQDKLREFSTTRNHLLLKKGVVDSTAVDLAEEVNKVEINEDQIEKFRTLLDTIKSEEPKSYHNFIRTKGMNKVYKTKEGAFESMQRTIPKLEVVDSDPRNVEIAIHGPSFAYNQILRVIGLLSEISFFEKDESNIEQCFDPDTSKIILKAPSGGLILTD